MDYVFGAFMLACLGGLYWSFPTLLQFRDWDENAVVTQAMIRNILIFGACSLVWIVYLSYLISRAVGSVFVQIIYSNRAGSRARDIDWEEWNHLPGQKKNKP